MTPVDQTRFFCGNPGDPAESAPGNCWTACIASLLDLTLTEVPDEAEFWKPGMTPSQSWIPYMKEAHRWLRGRGFVLVEVQAKHVNYQGPIEIFKSMHCILSGPSPRNKDVFHAVVGRGNEIVHDPHPSRAGLLGDGNEWWYEFLVRC